jgi:N-methylhydantoinase B
MVDPLSLQVFGNLFSSVAEEMGVALQRASHSPNIKMRRDFSCAIFDVDGRLLAQAAHIPVHLGAMPLAMKAIRESMELHHGDVAILNDPYFGGTHLPDISLVSAVFSADGTRLGYVMSRAHHADVGGMSPGSMPLSTEIYQEGVIIPPILLVEGGTLVSSVLHLLLRNVRTPAERHGDLEAQLAAQGIGEGRLARLAQRYGLESLLEHGAALQAHAETAMRRLIGQVQPGTYQFEDCLDDDGQGQGQVGIRVAVTRRVGSDDLVLDFTGSAPQQRGSVNAVEAVTFAAVLYVLRCLQGGDVPVNGGSMEPLQVTAPPGSVVGAQSPAAVAAGNVETSQRIVDVLFGALALALPDRVPAASQGTMNNLAFGGHDSERQRAFAYYETIGGGMGARPEADGASAVHDHMSNTLNTPVEALESDYPLRVRRYALRRDSGGLGSRRGGNGLIRELEFLAPATVTVLSERRAIPPYGLAGGAPGATGENALSHCGKEQRLPGKASFHADRGDVLRIETPGGGGLGTLPNEASR